MRLRLLGCLFVVALAFPPTGTAQVQSYHMDTQHTEIAFKINHLGIVPVRGQFKEFEGAFRWDEANPTQSSVRVTIQAASIDTGVERRDRHLRASDFFDVEKYPTITFESEAVHVLAENQYKAVGTLTMHGLSETVELPFTLTEELHYPNTANIMRGTQSEITINRTKFAIGSEQAFSQLMKNGSAWASEHVDITLNVTWERNIPHVADLLEETLEKSGIEAAEAQFNSLKAAYFEDKVYSFSTNAMTRLAKKLHEAGKLPEALAIHRLNIEIQPDWWWLYGPLAEAYAATGDTANAIATYERLLALNPDDEAATEALQKLKN